MQFYTLFILITVVVMALMKFEFIHIDIQWPVITVVFVLGVILLGLLTRLAIGKDKTPQGAEQDE